MGSPPVSFLGSHLPDGATSDCKRLATRRQPPIYAERSEVTVASTAENEKQLICRSRGVHRTGPGETAATGPSRSTRHGRGSRPRSPTRRPRTGWPPRRSHRGRVVGYQRISRARGILRRGFEPTSYRDGQPARRGPRRGHLRRRVPALVLRGGRPDLRPLRHPRRQGAAAGHKRRSGPSLFITPWNFPLAMATRKIAPAIAAAAPWSSSPPTSRP